MLWHAGLLILLVGEAILLLAKQASLAVWLIAYGLLFLLSMKVYTFSPAFLTFNALFFIFLCFNLYGPFRRRMFTKRIFSTLHKALPKLSKTEAEALNAGTVSWEGDIFRGSPDLQALLALPTVQLSVEEKAFLEGPVNQLCRMIDDWDITHVRQDMSSELWKFIKENKFFGMIIPKSYGGLGFSATAQKSILIKIYGRSITVATTISVPNSLGPAELLLKYGTDEQKNYYLPRLADGREIPCFALTGPQAGSDAASIPDKGVVCYQGEGEKRVLGIRLSWDKRYITLCPVATVIGLAFRLFDPDHLLGKKKDLGISCALIPADTKGVSKGRRHFPLNTAFLNGPTKGKDVFIPLNYLIGGAEMAGKGWRMLMECLSAGRAISLPSSAGGGAEAAVLATTAYVRLRKQFNQSIAKFEGIQAPLTRIAANAYIINAGLDFAAAAIDHGARPAVAGAILKYHCTERARQISLDAMDIHGGKGICLGPNNYLGRPYQNAPISITVEGANILTRSLIIFGQGAIRCHPFLKEEMDSIQAKDEKAFDRLFYAHVRWFMAHFVKSLIFSLTKGHYIKVPKSRVGPYYQALYQYSSYLAALSDLSFLLLGAQLKRKESLSGRLGDILSYLYLLSAVLKRFHQDGEPLEDLPLVEWCCEHLLYECTLAIEGLIDNFPVLWARFLLKPFAKRRRPPSDYLTKKVAQLLVEPNATRARLTASVFTEALENCPLGRMEAVFDKLCAFEELDKKIDRFVKEGKLSSLSHLERIKEAQNLNLLDAEQAAALKDLEEARQAVIAVDDFSEEELSRAQTLQQPLKKSYQVKQSKAMNETLS